MAAGHLPRRDAARPPADRRRVRPCGLRPPDRVREAARGHRGRRGGADPGARDRDRGRCAGDGPGRRAVVGRGTTVVRRDRRRTRGDGRAADRLPDRRNDRWSAHRQRPAAVLPRREPARARRAPWPRTHRRRDAAGPGADETAQPQLGPDRARSAASRVPRPVRRTRAVGDRRVRPRDPRVHLHRLAREPGRRSGLGPDDAEPDAPDGGARQEPPERDRLVAGQREPPRPELRHTGRLDPGAGSRPGRVLRAGPQLRVLRLLQPDVHAAGGSGGDRHPHRGRATGDRRLPGAGDPPPGAAVPPGRVRPCHGQRSRRAGRLPAGAGAVPAAAGRVRLGVDRPRPTVARSNRSRVRRGLRGARAWRELLHRRPAVPRPHSVARADRVQEGDRAGPDHRDPATYHPQPPHLHHPRRPGVLVVGGSGRSRGASRSLGGARGRPGRVGGGRAGHPSIDWCGGRAVVDGPSRVGEGRTVGRGGTCGRVGAVRVAECAAEGTVTGAGSSGASGWLPRGWWR